jgi:hypothetical protein
MILHPVMDLEVVVTPAGRLRLLSPAAGTEMWFQGQDVARWVALRLERGHLGDAAKMLSDAWGTDLAEVRCEIWAWAHRLWSGGLLQAEQAAEGTAES